MEFLLLAIAFFLFMVWQGQKKQTDALERLLATLGMHRDDMRDLASSIDSSLDVIKMAAQSIEADVAEIREVASIYERYRLPSKEERIQMEVDAFEREAFAKR